MKAPGTTEAGLSTTKWRLPVGFGSSRLIFDHEHWTSLM